jgi:enoyl-CoA hydratase/carnithine racemase
MHSAMNGPAFCTGIELSAATDLRCVSNVHCLLQLKLMCW